ncbi:MAG TPA: zinc ribbon domain-containing protein [Chloroflexota bacterium]|nr:zinc ribbon domain-containing protein [Chloroflexota bacterium]
MPVYEYRCADCRQRATIFFRSFSEVTAPSCPHCNSTHLEKLVSRVAVLKSEDARLEALSDPSSLAGLDEDDPKAVAAWARRMGSEMGEDMGDDFDEMVDALERGEDPMAGAADDMGMGGMGMGGMGDGGLGGDDFAGGDDLE